MTTTLKSLLLTVALTGTAHGQGLFLTAGDTWTYHFTNLDYISSQNTEVGPPSSGGHFFLSFATTGSVIFRFELFEEAAPQGSFFLGTADRPFAETNSVGTFLTPGVWQDLDGSARFTVLDGSLLIDSLRFTVFRYVEGNPARVDTFQTIVTPVPEPASWALVILGSLVFWFARRTFNHRVERTGLSRFTSTLACNVGVHNYSGRSLTRTFGHCACEW